MGHSGDVVMCGARSIVNNIGVHLNYAAMTWDLMFAVATTYLYFSVIQYQCIPCLICLADIFRGILDVYSSSSRGRI
jgi:hypothetical protein